MFYFPLPTSHFSLTTIFHGRNLIMAGLIVERVVGQRILVGEEIQVQVVEVHGRKVRLRVMAPPEVVVLREELKIEN